MLFLLKYGTRTILIDVYDPPFFQCPNCKGLNTVSFTFTSTYYHFWYVPVFPIEKDGFARCSDCNLKIDSIKYSKFTKEEYKEMKKKFKHPFYTYTLAAILLSPFIIGIIAYLFT
jgi:MFS-type transporter involved in bile tolerance (Atg22 family)